MRSALCCAAALVIGVSMPTAQVVVQPRDAQPAGGQVPTGTASISGTVTVAGSGDPARRARVTVSGTSTRDGGRQIRLNRSATSDENGRFFIAALPEGRYTLSASKPGHVTISYGQRQAGSGRPGTPIELGDADRFEAHLQIPRGGVLTGTILDELGEATPGTTVRALRFVIQNGERSLQQGGTGSTDDRGIYRIYGLQPGEYVVCAMPRRTVTFSTANVEQMRAELQQAASQAAEARAVEVVERVNALQAQIAATGPDDEQRTAYATVCYPGTTQPTAAVSVRLAPGQERAGVDFQLQLVPVGTVEGVVVAPTAEAPRNVQISLSPAGPGIPGVGATSTRSGTDGRFRLNNVAPGQYRLTARGTLPVAGAAPAGRGRGGPAAPRVWAMADITVDGRDVADVALVLQPALSVSGQIAFDGTGTPPADLGRIRVTLSPAPGGGSSGPIPRASAASTSADANGRFTISNVIPGHYRVSAGGAAGWVIDSAVIDGQDALDFPVEVRPGSNLSGAVVTLTDRQTELTGVLSDGRGQPVPDYTLIIFPADSRYWTPGARRIQSTRPSTEGQFTFRNLPPGDYRIATVLDPEPGSWTDPEYLRELEAVSLRVSLGPGEKKTQNIRIAQ